MKEPKERIIDTTPRRGYAPKPDGRRGRKPKCSKCGYKKPSIVKPTYGIKCYNCERPTRSEKLYCKKCRYDLHYSRRVDGHGNRYMELEDFVNDPFYD